MSKPSNVQVAIRIRPLNEAEIAQTGHALSLEIQGNVIVLADKHTKANCQGTALKGLAGPAAAAFNRKKGANQQTPTCFSNSLTEPDVVETTAIFKGNNLPAGPNGLVSTQSAASGGEQHTYTFDHVFGMFDEQQDIFDVVGLPVVESVMQGYNGTVMAYGQTGSGKTHSMLGPAGGTPECLHKNCEAYAERGLMPRVAEELFRRLYLLPLHEMQWRVTVSIFELYKESIGDLLLPSGTGIPANQGANEYYKIREDLISGKGVYVENLTQRLCETSSDLLDAIRAGQHRRKTATTLANETSSRSHCLSIVTVEQINFVKGGLATSSRLNLIDLAGSEKVAKTLADGERLKEAQLINKSLTLLGNVIFKLTDGKSKYIPYRDSKLTRIIQDSLGGNSMTTLLCHCSPAVYNAEETHSTLRFAARAKQIRNQPRVNRDLTSKEMKLSFSAALERIHLLEERLAVQQPATLERDGADGPSKAMLAENAELRSQLESQWTQLDENQKELLHCQEELAISEEQLQFNRLQVEELQTQRQNAMKELRKVIEATRETFSGLEEENAQLRQELDAAHTAMREMEYLDALTQGTTGQLLEEDPWLRGAAPLSLLRLFAQEGRRSSPPSLPRHPDAKEDKCSSEDSSSVGYKSGEASIVHRASFPVCTTPKRSTGTMTCNFVERAEEGSSKIVEDSPPHTFPTSRQSLLETFSSGRLFPSRRSANIGTSVDFGEQVLRLEELSDTVQQMRRDAMTANATRHGLEDRVTQLSEELERVQLDRDNAQQEVDALRTMAQGRDSEEETLKARIAALEAMLEARTMAWTAGDEGHPICRIDQGTNTTARQPPMVDDGTSPPLLGGGVTCSTKQRLKAVQRLHDKIRAISSVAHTSGITKAPMPLESAERQREFADFALLELLVKGEDMDVVERDLRTMAGSRKRKEFIDVRARCVETLDSLRGFIRRMASQLVAQVFHSGSLESRRLALMDDLAALTARADAARMLIEGA